MRQSPQWPHEGHSTFIQLSLKLYKRSPFQLSFCQSPSADFFFEVSLFHWLWDTITQDLVTWMSGCFIPEGKLGWYQVPDSAFLPLSISTCCSIFLRHSISFNKGWSLCNVLHYTSFGLWFLTPKWFVSILQAKFIACSLHSKCVLSVVFIENFKAFFFSQRWVKC